MGVIVLKMQVTWEDGKALAEGGDGCHTTSVRTSASTVQSKRQKDQTVNTGEATGREKGLLSQALPVPSYLQD